MLPLDRARLAVTLFPHFYLLPQQGSEQYLRKSLLLGKEFKTQDPIKQQIVTVTYQFLRNYVLIVELEDPSADFVVFGQSHVEKGEWY